MLGKNGTERLRLPPRTREERNGNGVAVSWSATHSYGGSMSPSRYSRLVLIGILAFGVGAITGCNRSIAAPPEVQGSAQAPIQFPQAIELSAQFVSGHDYVVLTWTIRSWSASNEPLDFRVERASDPAGPWNTLVVTRAMTYGDNVTLEQRCYRVSAIASGGPSFQTAEPLCVSREKARY